MLAPILVTGDDALSEQVCAELADAHGAPVRLVCVLGAERRRAFEAHGVLVIARDPDSDSALREAGVADATTIITLSNDDEANLAVALRARMINPNIRVVLRQFGTKIGRKIEQNLPDSTVLSPAAHSAATYAGAALDPGVFFGLRFPEADRGRLLGFTTVTAAAAGIAKLTVGEAEQMLGARIVAVGPYAERRARTTLKEDDRLIIFGPVVERRAQAGPLDVRQATAPAAVAVKRLVAGMRAATLRLSPVVRNTLIGAAVFYAMVLLFLHNAVHLAWASALFDVAEIASNAGLGDASLSRHGVLSLAGAIAGMIGGTIFTSIFIGYVSSAITRAQWTALQGLRRIHRHDHVVICGAGRTGGAVVELLTALGKRVVVVDPHPDPNLIRLAREGAVDLLTGDATHEDVLELCGVEHACALMALTNSDPGNLEIALGARAMRPDVPLVVRMENRTFAEATAELFGIATFSPAELCAPAFAGLAHVHGTIGRVRFGGVEHTIVQRRPADREAAIPENAVALCTWSEGQLALVRNRAAIDPSHVALFAYPLERQLFHEPDHGLAPEIPAVR